MNQNILINIYKNKHKRKYMSNKKEIILSNKKEINYKKQIYTKNHRIK